MADVAEIHTMIKEMKDMMTGLKNGLDRLEARGYGEFSPYRHRLNNNPRTPTVLPIEGCTVTFVVAPVGQAKRIWLVGSLHCLRWRYDANGSHWMWCGDIQDPVVRRSVETIMRNAQQEGQIHARRKLIQRSMGFGG